MSKDHKETMIQNLETLPDAIKTKEEKILKDKREFDEAKYRIALYELGVEKAVAIDADPDGKKKYTNDVLRKSEISRRLKEDSQFQNHSAALLDIKNSLDTESINLDFLKNRLRSLIAISRIMGD